ncbi:MAG: dUTP diphosphatase [Clostridiaceae bacterium]|jgi:dUTP pyrophosphatase|nr:dUTP diphosphatase [Clostridiaceae bacterium]
MTELSDVAIHIERCRAEASLPFYAHPGDAGMDLRAAETCVIEPGQTVAVPTGLRLAIPVGYEIQIRPRSGLSLHTPLRVPNSPGTIDSGFRDEVCVLLSNSGSSGSDEPGEPWTLDTKGNQPGAYRVRVGDRIAQMVLAKVETIRWEETGSVREVGNDRGGGFGHSGVR